MLNPSRWIFAAVTLPSIFVALPAVASPNFPSALQEAAGLECEPSCTICHDRDPGERGTANKDFAFSMVDEGLLPRSPETVASAFDALMDADSDSDGDSDVNELTSDPPTDPNSAANDPLLCQAEIRQGCSHAEGSEGGHWYVPLLISFSGAALVFLRRRASFSRRTLI